MVNTAPDSTKPKYDKFTVAVYAGHEASLAAALVYTELVEAKIVYLRTNATSEDLAFYCIIQ